jgi:signal transduction histidine kinase
MQLADFLAQDMKVVLQHWEAFASAQMPAAATMTPLMLRDHGEQILQAIALDLQTSQSPSAQALKSLGLAPAALNARETAAQTHALLRARHGFDINQLAAEYRALRASVLRLWTERCRPAAPDLDDMMRFNEAIDQALAESIQYFSMQVEQSRNLLLGMLGHDMRTPLQTIQMTAFYLARINAGPPVSAAVLRLVNSSARLKALLDDLQDFGRTRLGLGIAITPQPVNLQELFHAELEDIRVVYPDRKIELTVSGNSDGDWDGNRLQQLIENLVVNAIKYGNANSAVQVQVRGEKDAVSVRVCNAGQAIEQQTLDAMFDPLQRGVGHAHDASSAGSLGLGLYISREIARAHGGEISASSLQQQTVFQFTLPRQRKTH